MTSDGIIPTAFETWKKKYKFNLHRFEVVALEQLQQEIVAEINNASWVVDTHGVDGYARVVRLKTLLGTESET